MQNVYTLYIGGYVDSQQLENLYRQLQADKIFEIAGGGDKTTVEGLKAVAASGGLLILQAAASSQDDPFPATIAYCRASARPFDLLSPAMDESDDATILQHRPGFEDRELQADAAGDPVVPLTGLLELVTVFENEGPAACKRLLDATAKGLRDLPPFAWQEGKHENRRDHRDRAGNRFRNRVRPGRPATEHRDGGGG